MVHITVLGAESCISGKLYSDVVLLLPPVQDSINRMTDLGRITRTARPCLSLTPSLNCLPVTASGSISCHVMASGL